MASIHTEIQFENDICADLKDSGWLYDGPLPYVKGYAYDQGYDPRLALFPEDVIAWIQDTQPAEWAKFQKNHTKDPVGVFLRRLADELDRERTTANRNKPTLWGTLHVLRNGFKDVNATFKMAQFAPSSKDNPEAWALYGKNRLRVVRQLHYSLHNNKSIDLVLFLNGLPVATMELKTDTTQSIEHAIRQYKNDRAPIDGKTRLPEPLLSFGKRALVHFAVSTDEVRMTTHLEGANTRFLPFNRGLPDNQGGAGAGNPVDTQNGYATTYLWKEVLEPNNWMAVMGKFLATHVSEVKNAKGKAEIKKTLLFPRYHQWDAVTRLVRATLADKVGKSYLVQHSAGSGKSNTIGWLAHRLAVLHDAQDCKVFNSVIVITDRKVLDSQLQDTIAQFTNQDGAVANVTKGSAQLVKALNSERGIIVTTLQKFPHILDNIQDMKDKKFAIILDEAHSSQSGNYAITLHKALTKDSNGNNQIITAEDAINAEIKARVKPSNVSYYAFTATPKAETIALFGSPSTCGAPPTPFHVYSMQQAIEEGFILDVLKGYTTYETAFKLEQIGQDPDVKAGRAKTWLARYAHLHPTSIAQKVAIIIEHYREHVVHQLEGQAKAMVVTNGRIDAVRYKKAFDAYITRMGYVNCKALVAYSDEVTDNESNVFKATEKDLNPNGECDDAIKTAFDTDSYQVLIVASKYQTGFDQPKLCAMYVDKPLDGVAAVQTLSRLNRIYKGKASTVVVDFRNKAEDILNAFRPYYRTARLTDITDPNLVHTLRTQLDGAGVYQWAEVESFASHYFNPKGQQKHIHPPLQAAHQRFLAMPQESQDLFREQVLTYIRVYDFLSMLISYDSVGLEQLHAFCRMLSPRLNGPWTAQDGLDDSVRLVGYKLINEQKHQLQLAKGVGGPLRPTGENGGNVVDEPEDRLSVIIQKMNKVFSGNLSDADFTGYVTTLIGKMVTDATLKEQAKANDTVDSFAKGDYTKTLERVVIEALESHNEMASQALKPGTSVLEKLAKILVDEVYRQLRA